MSALVQNRSRFIPQGFSEDRIVYQWVLNNNTRIVTVLQSEEGSLLCNVFNSVMQKYTNRPVNDEWSLQHHQNRTWERLIPEVVDTPKGSMCILREINEKCYSKSFVKAGQSIIILWSFYTIKDELVPPSDFVKYITDLLNILWEKFNKNEIVSSLALNTITNRVGRWVVSRAQIEKWPVNKDCLFPRLVLDWGVYGDAPSLDLDNCKSEIERCDKLWRDFYPIIQNNEEHSILGVSYDRNGNPCGFKRRPVIREMSLIVEAELDQLDSVPNPKWIIDRKEISVVRRENQIKYVVRDVETRRGISTGSIASGLDEEGMQRAMEDLSKRCVYFLDNGVPFFGKVLRRWKVTNHKEFRLIKEKNNVCWWLFDSTTQTNIRSDIYIHEYSADYPEHFYDKILEYPDNRSLINVRGHRVNEILFNRLVASSFSTRPEFLLSFCLGTEQCAVSTSEILRDLLQRSVEEQSDIMSNFSVKRINVYDVEGTKFIQPIVEPSIVQPSQIDDRVLLTKFMWAVTLVRMGAEELDEDGKVIVSMEQMRNMNFPKKHLYGQHAQIIIEGIAPYDEFYFEDIKKNQRFCIMCEFGGLNKGLYEAGPGYVNIKNFSLVNNIRYVERSQTWKRSYEKVIEMLNSINREYRREVPVPNYFKPGGDCFVASEDQDNCITWTKEKLKLAKIYCAPSYVGANTHTVTSYYTYPKKFHEENIPEDHDLL